MEEKSYEWVENQEENHWWYQVRKNIIIDLLKKYAQKESKIVDLGCGSGYILSKAKSYFNNLLGIEHFEYQYKFDNIIKMDACNTNLESNSVDVALSLDVLEHIEIESDLLKEVHRILKKDKDGTLIVTVPANQGLFSSYDKYSHHFRRYSKKTLTKVLQENGFEIERMTYFNTFLFPLVVIIRMLEKIRNKSSLDNYNSNRLNGIFYYIFNIERYLLHFMNFPFGVSLLVVCKKKINV